MTIYLDVSDLLAAGRAFLDAEPVVHDLGLLESVLARPQAAMYGVEAYPDLRQKAAALLHSLCKNHGLVDGNKRLAWVATRLFYALNGHTLAMDHDDAYTLVMGVADGTIDDVKTIAERLGTATR